ncbi:DUF4367 domain-containing protein [Emergencia timonensis]|uniref:DUF4367 domain-containing protein n=1 Tax=Emergencia timonensis TaxID=1776384 RepID=UPI003AB93E6B
MEKFEIKNTPVVISTRNNQTIVIWQGNGFTFTISGMLEKTECLKMLNSCNIA